MMQSWRSPTAFWMALGAAAGVLSLGSPGASQAVPPDMCLTPLIEDEPLCSPALSPSEWPISHRGAYAQGSSPFPGPTPSATVQAEHLLLPGPPITLAMSPTYTDGGTALWGSVLGLTGAIVKIDHPTFSVVDTYVPADEEVDPPAIPLGVSGAYSVADRSFNFILGRADFVEIFRDSVAGDRSSDIELAKRMFLPANAFCRDSDLLVGGVMLPDGMLAFATEQAVVGVIPSDIDNMTAANVQTLPSENGADCTDPSIADEDLETVSNSLAADENGGFYMVTDAAVIKYQWDGTTLQKIWRAAYTSDPPFSLLRLGPGSGSTPSLMGTAHDDDRFVVITDGQELMHLVLMWRDEIPSGWSPIAPGKDPRIACEVPITFGDPSATRSLSEQSVLVRGFSAVVVNNLLTSEEGLDTGFPIINPAIAALEGGNPAVAPRGIERIDWDPESQTCVKVWTNTEISLPNAIPTMSAATDLMYAIGQRDGVWGLEAIDFATGESASFDPSALAACPQEVIDLIAPTILAPFLLPALERLPASCENSFFAATEVGPDGTIYTGTFQGVSRFVPDAVFETPPRRNAVAGVRQGLDLGNRGRMALGADVAAARDAVGRAQIQLDAAATAITTASGDGGLDASSAAGATTHVDSAITHLAAAEAALDTDVAVAEGEIATALVTLAAALDWLTPCPPVPQSDCQPAARSRLLMQQRDGARDRLAWRWVGADTAGASIIPDPTRRTDYALCVYNGSPSALRSELRVPADRTQWRVLSRASGFSYRDREGTQAGIVRALVKDGRLGTRARLTSRGDNLPTLPLPLAPPLTLQLVNSETGLCWEATYEANGITRNTSAILRARSVP